MELTPDRVPGDDPSPFEAQLEQEMLKGEQGSDQLFWHSSFQSAQESMFVGARKYMIGKYDDDEVASFWKDEVAGYYAEYVMSVDDAERLEAAGELMHRAMHEMKRFVDDFKTGAEIKDVPELSVLTRNIGKMLSGALDSDHEAELLTETFYDIYSSQLDQLFQHAKDRQS